VFSSLGVHVILMFVMFYIITIYSSSLSKRREVGPPVGNTVPHVVGIAVVNSMASYEGVSKIFRTDAVQIIKVINKLLLKLPTSTQLRGACHAESLDMVVLPSTGASR
jgi:hypothetical protein